MGLIGNRSHALLRGRLLGYYTRDPSLIIFRRRVYGGGKEGRSDDFDCVKIKPIDTLIRFFNIPMIPPGAHYPEPP